MTVPTVTVVGSINQDLSVVLDALPDPGQTVAGGPLRRGVGGKGANQAIALARLGRTVRMVGAVGSDDGEALVAALRADRVDVTGVATVDGPSGTAIVLVHGAESTIVISGGANDAVPADRDRVAAADAVLVQCEVPDAALVAAAEHVTGLFVVNPAPARPLPAAVLDRVDVLVPNRGELAVLAGTDVPAGWAELAETARTVHRGTTVVTCGVDGALVVTGDGHELVPAVPVEAVDATAAGDSFVAALTDALLDGASPADAARWAVRVAAVTVTRPGAAMSLPHRADVP